MNATETIAKIKSLPALPTVIAADVLHAQGYAPTADERAAITAHAEFFETMGMPRTVNIKVVDFGNIHIGNLAFYS
ncbi:MULTISPECIES: hypothetical protein [Mycolicibacterium]|uniref:Uncharacterized protein n=1 Tax=Mycolicibacterium fortuitum TaxID=1766 RepID=A0AAE4VDH6_MYCFO|nr:MULTISPECIES: hypothetical protein [Mycolicibacterium]MBU8814015.1 hypothetical protein [Mycolicibacterium goodii]MDV7193315.1 hypothetical protein [Mycolicibacterium fortuitum]MDV7206004.1 hypothetical protein [Mycolicibacterium fortuitum]MDV7227417.1 hypothetical protein [Mycolicibacterium fortuitum]MDV7259886.1 hypothetical protein [Mycolicibacterium fortuitum]